nr:DUF6796 family protein [uncultured Shuttleworthia sp.]
MKMNMIGIHNNLDRARIKKLLIIELIGSVMTGIGDFLVGIGDETVGANLAEALMSSAPNLPDAQLIWGGLLGAFGLFLEGLAFFAVYRLMADAAPKYAHIYRASIFGLIWLAPIGCHMNIGLLNYAYKNLLMLDAGVAARATKLMIYAFCVPLWVILIILWLPELIVQFKAFAKGYTPYPKKAKWFHMFVGMIPALVIAVIARPHTALGAGIGTTFLSLGNVFTFGGLLATLPDEERFEQFRNELEWTR